MPLRAFSLGIQFRFLENSLATSDTQQRKEGYLVFLAIINVLERDNFFSSFDYIGISQSKICYLN